MPFRKILIANRGEIALRIMRTCRSMGIASVAVYSDADLASPHVRYVEEAVRLGQAPPAESYLNIDRIIDAARRTQADAIHPGYGFLAENPAFPEACETAGVVFIGPSADSIRKMGLKSTARAIAAAAGVPVVPGCDEADQTLEILAEQAGAIGFPIIIKASAGGGGKGMAVVNEIGQMAAAIETSRRQAVKSFGDGSLLIEKYVDHARHVEIQIFGDHHGNLVHLFERECSIQRRHQKVIEESPSPGLTPDLRRRMGEAAVAVGRTIAYTNAGTVEFILAPSGEFYLIEVNTRLQVEHPVTEMTTGLDLVRLQIEIAEGRPIAFEQEDIRQIGHSIEARLYAEDPGNDFLPDTGTIVDWTLPPSISGVRIDTGIEKASVVGIHYDPLLAKLIAHGPDRATSLRKIGYALRNLTAAGVRTNRELLIRVLDHPDFVAGRYDTGFISEHLAELIVASDPAANATAAAVIALYLQAVQRAEATILPRIPPGYRNNPFRDPSIRLEVAGDVYDVSLHHPGGDGSEVRCGDWKAAAEVVSFEPGRIRIKIDGVQQTYRIAYDGDRFFVNCPGREAVVTRLPRYPRALAASEHESASAPMPGQVLKILVDVGQEVLAGEPLVILEAMKMEQTLRASTGGVVEAVLVRQGDVVAPGDILVEIAAR